MRKIFFWIVIWVIFLAGCASTAKVSEVTVVSIARRGESLKKTPSAPIAVQDPVVLPAASESGSTSSEADITLILETGEGETCEVFTNPQYEGQLLHLVNQERTDSLHSLIEHALLTQIARQHSQEMACLDFFDHDSPELGSVELRVQKAGYDFFAIGENIASGIESPEEVLSAWMSSFDHRRNLLSGDYVHVGIGYAKLAGVDQPAFWTILLAHPQNP